MAVRAVHVGATEEGDAVGGVQEGGESAGARAMDSSRKTGGKGKKKKKKGNQLRRAREANGVEDEVPIRLDLEFAGGDLAVDGEGANEASVVQLDPVSGGKDKIGGQDGEERSREMHNRPQQVRDEVGGAKMHGRRPKVSRELQALQAVPGASGAPDGAKAAESSVGFVSSTRQRLR